MPWPVALIVGAVAAVAAAVVGLVSLFKKSDTPNEEAKEAEAVAEEEASTEETPEEPCADCEATAEEESSIVWEKQPGATDEDVELAKQMWEDALSRRLPDGSKPRTVLAMEALEQSDMTTTIRVGERGNSAGPASRSDSQTHGVGSPGTINFNPEKRGTYGDGVDRDPESSLAHEAYHVYEYTLGDSHEEREGREVSASTVENEHRVAKGLPQRQRYGTWDIPQYEAPE